MQTQYLGYIVMKYVGEYDETTLYHQLQVVTYDKSSYCCHTDCTVVNTPLTDTDHWFCIAKKAYTQWTDFTEGEKTDILSEITKNLIGITNDDTNGFIVEDTNGDIKLKYTSDGLDATKVSEHFLELATANMIPQSFIGEVFTNPSAANITPRRIGDTAGNSTTLEVWESVALANDPSSWVRKSAGKYGGTLITDFNAPNISGVSTALNTALNAPNNLENWYCLHMNSNAGVASAAQIAIGFTTGKIYQRLKINSTYGNWIGGVTATELSNLVGTKNNANDLCNEINVDNIYPLPSGYYTLTTAIAAVDDTLKKSGVKITFATSSGVFESWQFIGSNISEWNTENNWEPDNTIQNSISEGALNLKYGFTLIKGKYIDTSGNIKNSVNYSYSNPYPVSEGDIVVMWRQGIGCAALCITDSVGSSYITKKMNIADNASDTERTIDSYRIQAGEEYVAVCSKTEVLVKYPPFIIKNSSLEAQENNKLEKFNGIIFDNAIILTEKNKEDVISPESFLNAISGSKYYIRITPLTFSSEGTYSIYYQNGDSPVNIISNQSTSIKQQHCEIVTMQANNAPLRIWLSYGIKAASVLIEYTAVEAADRFITPMVNGCYGGKNLSMSAEDGKKIKDDLLAEYDIIEAIENCRVTTNKEIILPDLSKVSDANTNTYYILNDEYKKINVSLYQNDNTVSDRVLGVAFFSDSVVSSGNLIYMVKVLKNGITNLGDIVVPDNCKLILLSTSSTVIDPFSCTLYKNKLDNYSINNYVDHNLKLLTNGINNVFENSEIKMGRKYLFKVLQNSINNFFSLFYKDSNLNNVTVWNNSSNYETDKWYALEPSNDSSLYIWEQYWGTDINGNASSEDFIEVNIVLREYVAEAKDNVTNREIINNERYANEYNTFSSKYILSAINNNYIYDAVAARMNDTDDFMRVFHLDCARKYFSIANIKLLIDMLSTNNIKFLELHFSENQGFRFLLDNHILKVNGNTYDLSTVVGDGLSLWGTSPDGSNMWLTESDMNEIIVYATTKNVEIIPAFDMPGHMGAVLRLMNNPADLVTSLDIKIKENIDFALALAEMYINYFSKKGCRYYNFGCDEANLSILNQSTYALFINKLAHLIVSYDMIPLAYNDAICAAGKYPYINKGIKVIYWNSSIPNAASEVTLVKYGYNLIRTGGVFYYLFGETDQATEDAKYEQLLTTTIDGSLYKGAVFGLWCDYANADGADGGTSIIPKMQRFIKAFADVVVY